MPKLLPWPLFQRGPDGQSIPATGYPPIPDATHFMTPHFGSCVPKVIHGWQWSDTFGKWSALVTFGNDTGFDDGWYGFTYPYTRTRPTDAERKRRANAQ